MVRDYSNFLKHFDIHPLFHSIPDTIKYISFIFLAGARFISGKALREPDPTKPKPFPYEEKDFKEWSVFNKTSYR